MKPNTQNEERNPKPDGTLTVDRSSTNGDPVRSYLTIPVAFGMAVVLETVQGTGFEGLAGTLG